MSELEVGIWRGVQNGDGLIERPIIMFFSEGKFDERGEYHSAPVIFAWRWEDHRRQSLTGCEQCDAEVMGYEQWHPHSENDRLQMTEKALRRERLKNLAEDLMRRDGIESPGLLHGRSRRKYIRLAKAMEVESSWHADLDEEAAVCPLCGKTAREVA